MPVTCQLCGLEFMQLQLHLKSYNISFSEYIQRFPGAETIDKGMLEDRNRSISETLTGREKPLGECRNISEAAQDSWERLSPTILSLNGLL